jgi:CPA2 family monovalent cation:H+ antiporter-2
MVFLSTFAASQGAGATEIALTIVRLLFYLVLWLLLGIYIIPTLLKKVQRLMNDETLLIVSLGLCLGMVLLFVQIGFSSALGAFIAGSILAGTIHAVRIEHLTKPIKDFFGAVFFISVGMMVDPAVIVQFAVPILVISLVTICGKLVFSTLGVILSGNRLHTAVYCGVSLAQIGEFAFIIALLTINLNLASEFMYPVVVSVSVITTFTTPFCIKSAEKIYGMLKKILPNKIFTQLDSYTSDRRTKQEKDSLWKRYLKTYFVRLLTCTVVSIGIILLNSLFVAPFLNEFIHGTGAKLLNTLITLTLMSPFIFGLLFRQSKEHTLLVIRNKTNRLTMLVFMMIQLSIAVFLIIYTINQFMGISMAWLILPALLIISALPHFDTVFAHYLKIEARFLTNFNEKQLSEWALNENGGSIGNRLNDELWVGQYRFEPDIEHQFNARVDKNIKRKFRRFGRKHPDATLSDVVVMMMERMYNINIIKIISGKKHTNIPANVIGNTHKLRAGDTLFLLSTKEQLDSFNNTANFHTFMVEQTPPVTLRRFIDNQDTEEQQLLCFAFSADKTTGLVGKSIKDSGMLKKWNCMVIGIQRGVYPIVYPDVQNVIRKKDKIWVLGSQKMFQKLVQAGLIETEPEKSN